MLMSKVMVTQDQQAPEWEDSTDDDTEVMKMKANDQ